MAFLYLALVAILIYIVESNCGYVDLSANLFGTNVGNFHLSTNKCQVIDATINLIQEAKLNASLTLRCDPTDSTRLYVREYRNQLCVGNPHSTSSITSGESISLFYKDLKFEVNELSCSTTTCGIDITFANNCRGSSASNYVNFGIPPSLCQTFANDWGYNYGDTTQLYSLLSMIPEQLLPEASATALFDTALKFKCCKSDNSLLIYNYSDPSNNCEDTPYNTLRLSSQYNGQCFVLGSDQLPFDGQNKATTNSINIVDSVYGLRYTWDCDSTNDDDFVDCDSLDIQPMDESLIMNLCPDDCLDPNFVLPTPAPTTSPTFHPITPGDGTVTAQPQNQQGQQPFSNASTSILIGVIVFLIIAAICVILLCVYHKRRMKEIVKENEKQEDAQRKDSKYEPMITGSAMINPTAGEMINIDEGNNDTNELHKNEDNNEDGAAYAMPSKTTDDGNSASSHDHANLLQQDSQPLP